MILKYSNKISLNINDEIPKKITKKLIIFNKYLNNSEPLKYNLFFNLN